MKKLIALTLATVMLLALCACGGGTTGGNSEISYDIPEGKVIPDDAVVDITIAAFKTVILVAFDVKLAGCTCLAANLALRVKLCKDCSNVFTCFALVKCCVVFHSDNNL